MGTRLVGPRMKEDSMKIPSIPPGFESLVPSTLNRMESGQVSNNSSTARASESRAATLEMELECSDDSKTTKSLRRRSGTKYNQFDNSSGDEYESKQHVFGREQLPKGVIRGCEQCSNCQKVTAKWHPEDAHRPILEEAPAFYPSEEEFEDTLAYISSIRVEAEKYGICRIVPPPSWKPPCPLRERNTWETSKFATRVQRIDKLQKRNSVRKISQVNHSKRRKKRRCMKGGVNDENSKEEIKISAEVGPSEAVFGFEPGPELTLDAFQKYADDFRAQYFCKDSNSAESGESRTMPEEQWQPSVEIIEGEYWRLVEKPTEEIEVLYGADLETGVFGSGFPKSSQQVCSASDNKYINSGWNLNNFPRLPGSVLSFESSDISGVLVPWLYIGMCFSSFCWHVEDHHLYSLNYMHWGAPKMWYGVPGSDALKLESAMRKHLPDLFEEQPDLLHKLVTQLSPSILRSEGVPVYRCVQNPGEFVLTFPRAYHAGFNCGFNCAEAVNVAPVDWLPHGQNAIELYRVEGRKTSISHDKLLLGAAREAVRATWEYNLLRKSTSNNLRWKDICGKGGILSTALKNRVEMERMRREFLCKSSQALKMESSFDASSERECSVCLFDLHLSAAGCHNCSPDKYACLNHAKQLCSCSWGVKFFLFRYDINELNILVEALEGKLSAAYRWARLDLGLALSSYVSKDGVQIKGKLSSTSQGSTLKEMSSPSNQLSSKEQKEQPDEDSLDSSEYIGSTHASQNLNPPMVILALTSMKGSVKVKSAEHFRKENPSQPAPQYRGQLSEVSSLSTPLGKLPSKRSEQKQSRNQDIIFLSDDEGDESIKNPCTAKHAGSSQKPVSPKTDLDSSTNNPCLTTAVSDPSVMLERIKHGSRSECIKVEDLAEAKRYPGTSPLIGSSSLKVSLTGADSNNDSSKKDVVNCNESNADGDHKPQRIKDEKPLNEDTPKNLKLGTDTRPMENIETVSCNPSGSPSILDRYYRQKGPRIAKVIRRINCNVEPLDFGNVRAGTPWCDSRAIYTKGFKSRVRYIDVVDPTNMCYYISEILDAGRDGPLFMVSVEHSPSEVFVHVSAARCWEMVRERVNHEITRQHKLGKAGLPPLQPPGSLDGMEMYGFSSPAIVQVIQAMDQNRVCTEYWKSRPLMQIPQQSQYLDSSCRKIMNSEPLNDQETRKSHLGVEKILDGLLKRANLEELSTLYSLLHDNSTDERSLLTRCLKEEIHKRPR